MKTYYLIKYYSHKIIQKFLYFFNLRITNNKIYEKNLKYAKSHYFIKFLENCEDNNLKKTISNVKNTRSQWFQDLFVLNELNFKRNGFFVEFGACDGEYLSNTYLLEKEFGWDGILSEPAKSFHSKIKQNRDCNIDFSCVTNSSEKKLKFIETKNSALSTTIKNAFNDKYKNQRILGKNYFVETISLNMLLMKYNCPEDFDYLSIDTEGTEYEIIKGLNFDKYRPKIISIEHNYITNEREKIFNFLTSKRYKRVKADISYCDDWYVRNF